MTTPPRPASPVGRMVSALLAVLSMLVILLGFIAVVSGAMRLVEEPTTRVGMIGLSGLVIGAAMMGGGGWLLSWCRRTLLRDMQRR